jgi:alpha-tubulin suppressor-like RCC1 family protein
MRPLIRCLPLVLSVATVLGAQQPPASSSALPSASAASWGAVVVNPDGSVTAWPEESTGRSVQVALPRKAIQAAVHQYTAFVLLDDGTVMGWGSNNYESLGIASERMRESDKTDTPRSIPVLHDIVQIAATYGHAVAVRRDGAVFAWGETVDGLRGDANVASNVRRPSVTQVPGLTDIVHVATAARHSLALSRDGHVFAWGANARGELGSGGWSEPRGPAPVVGLDDVIAIAAGGSTSFALKRDGTVWAWGWNQSGMLGNGLRPSTNEPGGVVTSPVIVKGVANARAIVAGEGHAIALIADGTLRAWGHNGYGQIGNGTAGGYQLLPIRVPSIAKVVGIGAGGYRSFAATSDGQLWHWGTPIPVSPVKRPNQKAPVVLER